MASLRLLLVSQPTAEGAAIHVASLAAAAVSGGHSVTVACPAGGNLSLWAHEAGARWVESDLARRPAPSDLTHGLRLRRLMAGADVVHLHSSKAGALGRLALAGLPRGRRPACVFTPHAWSWLPGGVAAPLYRSVERALGHVADVIVAVSPEEAAQGEQALGARLKGRLRVIPNGVDASRISPSGPRAERSDAPLLVCVGRLSRQKGQDVAIAALAHLEALGRTDVRLRLVGDGPDDERLRRVAADLGVAQRVEWTGHAQDPAAH